MSRAIRFEVWRDDQLVDATTLTQNVIKIGRLPSSHLRIDDDAVARMHAVIEVQDERLRLVDLGSAAGTLLNGERVQKSAALALGDAVSLGRYQVRLASATPVAARPVALPSSDAFERSDAPEVAEVMAVYGDTVLDVQHVGPQKRRTSAMALAVLGGVMLLGGGGYFASQTVMQAEAWQAYDHDKGEALVSGRPAPTTPGSSWSGIGIALGLLGLAPLGAGLIRLSDRDGSHYTIGEGGDISFATSAAALPDSSGFPLVTTDASGANSVRFTSSMSGYVSVNDQRYSLDELVASGQARQQGAAYVFPLSSGARCRIQHEGVTFHVNGVKPGKVVAGRGDVDKPFWLYSAASMVGIGSLLALAQLALPEGGEVSLEDSLTDNRFVGYIQQPIEEEPDEPDESALNDEQERGSAESETGSRAPGAEGKMGKPDSKATGPKRFAMKGPKDAVPQMSRLSSPDLDARQAGILGMIQQDSGHFLASPTGGAFSVGNEEDDIWGGLVGTDVGETHGVGGLGLVGSGRGGQGSAEGTIGWGSTRLIGRTGGGGGCCGGYGRRSGAGFGARGKRPVRVRSGAKTVIRGAIDKGIIRRVVRSHINQVRHCYNQGLARDPALQGRVAVQFTIGSTGKVPMAVVSETSIKDAKVGNCIAKAVRRWSFPKPDGGGTVMVTYPFVLNPG